MIIALALAKSPGAFCLPRELGDLRWIDPPRRDDLAWFAEDANNRGKAARLSQRVEDNAFHLHYRRPKSGRLLTPRFDSRDFSEIGREIVRGKILNVHFD